MNNWRDYPCILHGNPRYNWEKTFGSIPDGLYLCHHCDQRTCKQLNHMWLDTQSNNLRDCATKGRSFVAKLTVEQVLIIRTSSKTKWELAVEFNVTDRTIRNIKNGRTWGYLQ